MRDVAAEAGVSQPTVSLVLGNRPEARVAAETRKRVLRVARELGYRPNLLARGLVRQRSYALGVIVPDLSDPFLVDVVRGAERVASEEGYAVLVCDAQETSPARHVEELRARLVDGIILEGRALAALPSSLRTELNLMVVDEPSGEHPGVASDARGAGRLATEHLLSLGHRGLAFLGPALPTHGFRFRERGFVETLREAGLPLPSPRLRRVPPTVAGGEAGMRTLLGLEEPPTAVFCANDLLAVGALKACATAGVDVPGRLSVVGCDDIEIARYVVPELTTVAVPAREMGARAARLLVRGLAGEEASPPSRPLPVRLVVRGTTGPAPHEVDA